MNPYRSWGTDAHLVLTCQPEYTPRKGTPFSTGYDCFLTEGAEVSPGQTVVLGLGFRLSGWVRGLDGIYWPASDILCILVGRSSTGRRGLHAHTGVIDMDYTGEVKACVTNISTLPQVMHPGERIYQLLCSLPIERAADNCPRNPNESGRGEGGFGSTGK